jgi:nitrogen fixation NifU-like protein
MTHDMYQQNILDHYKHPRNFGELVGTPAKAHAANPLCGDELDFYLVFDANDVVADVKFSGRGCTITMAGASMLSERLKGMSRRDVSQMTNDDMLNVLGVPINPARLKCATLALETVQQAIGHH